MQRISHPQCSNLKLLAGTLSSILAGLALVAASHTGLLPAAPDLFTYDWRTYLLAERAAKPSEDIAVILVDERSLTGYNYVSSIDRGLAAELVTLIDAAAPKAIGLNLIFDRPTDVAAGWLKRLIYEKATPATGG